MNDPQWARIGDPFRNRWTVSIFESDARHATEVAESLDRLGITFQANFRRDERNRPTAAYLAIYALEDQQRLVEHLGADLEPAPRKALELLTRARGPVPAEILRRMVATIESGKSHSYLAERLMEHGLIDGMGKGWTAKKVRSVLADYEKTWVVEAATA
jgi:hypothetical protein